MAVHNNRYPSVRELARNPGASFETNAAKRNFVTKISMAHSIKSFRGLRSKSRDLLQLWDRKAKISALDLALQKPYCLSCKS